VSVDISRRPAQVTLVHNPACHFCDDAENTLYDLSKDYAIDVFVVHLESAVGAELVARHRPAMNPLVLVDGAFFSSGRLPRKKLVKLLDGRQLRLQRSVVATER
jgi:hypothetical protein